MKKNPPLLIRLAEQLGPTISEEFIGQEHWPKEGKPLKLIFELGQPHFRILCGLRGSRKTTFARLLAKACDCEWIYLSAVLLEGMEEKMVSPSITWIRD